MLTQSNALSQGQQQLTLALSKAIQPKLRDYQQQVKRDLYQKINNGNKRVLVVASTGSGKTIIAASIVYDATIIKKRRVLFVVHRDVLIQQTVEKFSQFGIECGVIAGGYKPNPSTLVQIASVQSLSRRALNWFQPEIVIADESHLTSWASPMLRMFPPLVELGEGEHTNIFYIGLTATPFRLSKKEGMGDLFQCLVSAPPPGELIRLGYLVAPVYFGIKGADLENVRTLKGDYSSNDLDHVCNVPEVLEAAVREWRRLADGRLTIAFTVNVAHAINLAATFNDAGIPATHVDGSMSRSQRQIIYNRLASGEIKVLCSCEALAEGFDLPAVSCVLLARPSKSKSKYWQQVGRGLRPAEDKDDCIVIDQAGLVNRFGFIEDTVSFSLETRSQDQPGDCPTKQCPEAYGGCGAYVHIFEQNCPYCGYEFGDGVGKEKIKPTGELKLLVNQADQEKVEAYQNLLLEAYKRGYSPSFASARFKEKYSESPKYSWALGIFGDHPSSLQKIGYLSNLKAVARRFNKSESWVQMWYKRVFGEQFEEVMNRQ